MTRSPFTVFSAITVPCDKAAGGCGAVIGKRCTAKSGLEMAHCHTFRRKAADAQRTREVQDNTERAQESILYPRLFDNTVPGKPLSSEGLMKLKAALEFSKKIGTTPGYHLDLNPPGFLPMREPLPPRVPDLNPDDAHHGPSCDCGDCEQERNR